MVQNMNERILAKIHLDKILEDDSRKDELISIITHYFSSHPNVKKKWEDRYSAEVKTKNKKNKGKKHEKSEGENVFQVISNDNPDDITE
jgi:hypothetical protein